MENSEITPEEAVVISDGMAREAEEGKAYIRSNLNIVIGRKAQKS